MEEEDDDEDDDDNEDEDDTTLLASVNTLIARGMFCGSKYTHHSSHFLFFIYNKQHQIKILVKSHGWDTDSTIWDRLLTNNNEDMQKKKMMMTMKTKTIVMITTRS